MAGVKVTNDFGKTVLERFTSDTPTRSFFNQFKIGSGTTDPTVNDTDLEDPVPYSQEIIDNCDAITGWTASSGSTVTLQETLYKTGVASLNVTKTGSATASIYVYKTASAVYDFTSKDVNLQVYIADQATLDKLAVTGCFELRWGSDASNYYSWSKDLADFSIGWNRLTGFNSGNVESTTGVPTLTALDYIHVGFISLNATNTWAEGSVIIEDLKQVSASDYFFGEVVDYPVTDLATLQVTHRGYVSATQGNGYNVSEVGVFNEDGTPLMGTRAVFSPFSKDQNDEFIFVVKNRLRLNETTS